MSNLGGPTALAATWLMLGCGSIEPSLPPEPTFSYTVTRTTGEVLTFTGTSASWVTLALGGSGQPPYSFELSLAQAVEPGDNQLFNPFFSFRANGPRFKTYPERTTLRLGTADGDVVMATIGDFIGDSGTVTLRPLNSGGLEGSLDLWFTPAGGNPPPPSFHLVGTYLAVGQNLITIP